MVRSHGNPSKLRHPPWSITSCLFDMKKLRPGILTDSHDRHSASKRQGCDLELTCPTSTHTGQRRPIADNKCSLESRSSSKGVGPKSRLRTVWDAHGNLPARFILSLEAKVRCSVFILNDFLLLLVIVIFLLGSLSAYRDKGKIYSSMFVSVLVSYWFCNRWPQT